MSSTQMQKTVKEAHRWLSVGFFSLVAGAAGVGCTKPSEANIKLRKENSALQQRIEQLETMRKADESRRGVTTLPSSAGAVDLDAVYTTHKISFGRLTGVTGKQLRVFVTPVDQVGDDLKAAGGFEVTAVDPARNYARVGQWTFTPEQAKQTWRGTGLHYCYVLECPIEGEAPTKDLTVRVVFRDTLTGRVIEGETKGRIFKP